MDVAAVDDGLAALVEVVAQGEHRLVRPARELHRAGLGRRRRQVARVGLGRVLRDEVVTRVPQDRVEVRQHAEERRVAGRRRALGAERRGVDVVRLDLVARRGERVGMLLQVARRDVVAGLAVRRDTAVVLGREHQHTLLRRAALRDRIRHRLDPIGEPLPQPAGADRDVDGVARRRRSRRLRGRREVHRRGRADALVVLAGRVAVALAGRHLLGADRGDRPVGAAGAGDPHRDVDRAERAPHVGLDLLGRAVGDVEPGRLDVVRGLDLVLAGIVVEVARAIQLGRRVGDVERHRQVLLEHRLDLLLIVRERELVAARGPAAGGAGVELRRPADHAVVHVAVVDRVAVGLVEIRRALRLVGLDRAVAVGAGHRVEDRRVDGRVVGDVGHRRQQ